MVPHQSIWPSELFTERGTAYAARDTVLPNGDPAHLTLPATYGDALVLYIHGNNAPSNQFETAVEWRTVREWLIEHGVPIAESRGGGDDWGGRASRASYEQTVAWARELVPGQRIVVLGRSMGALVAYWLATESSFSHEVVGLLVSSGTTDLARRYEHAAGDDLVEMNIAYGIPSTTRDKAAFAAASQGHDPLLFDASAFERVRVLQMWGDADRTVPAEEHGAAWVRRFGSSTASLTVDVREGGDHTTGNGSYHQVEAISGWFLGLPEVVPVALVG